ncbi:MAG TPA: TIGR03862 family flavoprotein [Candidatus Methylacidiphilales bacterium]|nr:TIGR03862 family flavoprotein [Candidatus Methylacidiphilales bacterium]
MSSCDVLIIGGGPAGLRSAQLTSAAGLVTLLADRMPSVGRKFLVAGRGGLNLTHSEPVEKFPARYGAETARWQALLADFSPAALRAWAADLSIETFIGTSGRVFPTTKQAAPLLRRWIARLRKQGVSFRLRHQLTDFRPSGSGAYEAVFSTPGGPVTMTARSLIFALGGGSWPQTGSDGTWTRLFAMHGVPVALLAPANCGWEVAWPESFLAEAEGLPLKNLAVCAGDKTVAGELLITRYGLEGGAIYQLGRILRAQARPKIVLDLKPAFDVKTLLAKIPSDKTPGLAAAARAWRLGPAARSLLQLHAPFSSWKQMARLAKNLPVELLRPRPLAEAISTAGGIPWSELDGSLMFHRWPGVACAGEMIDWEAPTGGYLLHGCFATATKAALGVIDFLQDRPVNFRKKIR